MEYLTHLLIIILIYSLSAQGFNLVFGLGGLFNFAHIAFVAIGAYVAAILSTNFDAQWYIGLFTAILVACLVSLPIYFLTFRLNGDHFVLGSFALSSLISMVIVNWREVTKGALGIAGIPRPRIFSIELNNNIQFLLFVFVLVLFSLFFLWCLFRSPFARKIRSAKREISYSLALGNNVFLTYALFFILSAVFASLAGAIFAYYLSYIDPSSFVLADMIFILTICAVGSPGSFWGCLGATLFLVILPEFLRFIPLPPGVLGPLRQIFFAGILFIILYFRRAKFLPYERIV
ncbi:MAG TPA: branched-chain amino acid ABC transporter permease [Oligoflexia bacterium]|nr:branched-chain amino acid ABC transporter permease [Oligoflexia bacterium]HMP26934.1 branched-chain amino acid ABC transporter permease [Oligoflexia bacterium]